MWDRHKLWTQICVEFSFYYLFVRLGGCQTKWSIYRCFALGSSLKIFSAFSHTTTLRGRCQVMLVSNLKTIVFWRVTWMKCLIHPLLESDLLARSIEFHSSQHVLLQPIEGSKRHRVHLLLEPGVLLSNHTEVAFQLLSAYQSMLARAWKCIKSSFSNDRPIKNALKKYPLDFLKHLYNKFTFTSKIIK